MTASADHISLIRHRLAADYLGMFRESGGDLAYPFITPGSAAYDDCLWDWDSWLSNIALRQILLDHGSAEAREQAVRFERGCVLNFLTYETLQGWIPIVMFRQRQQPPEHAGMMRNNWHKPCLAQHAAFIVGQHGEAEWLRPRFAQLQRFVNGYRNHHRHAATGLFYWQNDEAIGVDNDPSTFFRPPRSSGSIYLNCLMFRELEATAWLADRLGLDEVAAQYRADAGRLRAAVLEHCWDERDGFFYSVDLNLEPRTEARLHSGQPRDWDCLIQRLGVWSGFLALWAGLATPEQAERVVAGHYRDQRSFNAPFGVRTLSRQEKMYNLRASGNPSSWLGPIWGISNYLTFRGLLRYGYTADARQLAERTIALFGRDFARFGALHEYYQPENGEPILNRGFQNWNYLVLNMIAWLEGKPVVAEF